MIITHEYVMIDVTAVGEITTDGDKAITENEDNRRCEGGFDAISTSSKCLKNRYSINMSLEKRRERGIISR